MGSIDTKGALLSGSIWGSLISLVPVLDHVLSGIGVIPVGVISDGYGAAMTFVGAAIAIWRRIKATKEIKGII